jgi:anti-sigma factor RsiW
MTRGTEHDLIRLLHGELPPERARELRERLRREPELAEAYQRLERTWDGLSLPPASPVPAGFSGRVMAHARAQGPPGTLSWSSAPAWVRAAAAAALIAGAAAGVGVGRSWPSIETAKTTTDSSSSGTVSALSDSEYNLADGYWDAVEDATGATSTSGGNGTGEVRR